jgi:hypothetical protein
METKILFKLLVVLPLILFADYLIMVLLGCASFLFGAGEDYMCGTYCVIGKIILGISAVFFFSYIFQDVKKIFKNKKYGTSTEE